MLDDFSQSQKRNYDLIKNSINKNEFSHAYLIEGNNAYEFALSLAKTMLCPKYNTNLKDCGECTQCKTIDDGNFPEIKIINPDGLSIKKEQLLSLKEEFKNKSIIGTRKVYIINEIERINQQSANALLKFLEEPEDGIHAILVTNSSFKILETIISRCQIISLMNSKEYDESFSTLKKINKTIKFEFEKEQIDTIIDFADYYENKGIKTILYTNSLWLQKFKEKKDNIYGLIVLSIYYKEILDYKLQNKIDIFSDYLEQIKKIASKNNINQIISKIKIINDAKNKLENNVNTNLLFDKMIIELEDIK